MKSTKIRLFLFILLLAPIVLFSQKKEQQTGDTIQYKTLIPEAKQGLLKNMSMIANMRFAGRSEFIDGENTISRFVNEQFRLEFRGMVHEKVYFRFRDRYTRSQDPQSIDNLSRSTDLAYIRVDVSDKFNFSAGKMCADWGAYEFDYNPIDIYEYSDIIEYADNFLTGVGASYKIAPNHQATLQVLNSRTQTFEELYGQQPNLVESKLPLAFVANWRGSFFNGKFNTIWSYAIHNEAEKTNMNYIALGNQVKLNKFTIEYDFKWSQEDLDRTGIISQTIPDALYPYSVENTLYIGHWVHLYYRLNQNWNFAFIGMYDTADWTTDGVPGKTEDRFRTALGFIPTIEYYPFKDLNLRFYINYVGRDYDYSDYATTITGASDYSTGRVSIGFVTPLGIF